MSAKQVCTILLNIFTLKTLVNGVQLPNGMKKVEVE